MFSRAQDRVAVCIFTDGAVAALIAPGTIPTSASSMLARKPKPSRR